MPRICIAALAILALLAPTASARVEEAPVEAKAKNAFLVQPERVTDTGGMPKVMPERITDHRSPAPTSSRAGTTDETTAALNQEQYYASQGKAVASLVREQESTSGSGNQGAPQPDVDGTPWAIMLIGIAGAALLAGGVTLMTRRTRTRFAA
jgi:hypothetical protein